MKPIHNPSFFIIKMSLEDRIHKWYLLGGIYHVEQILQANRYQVTLPMEGKDCDHLIGVYDPTQKRPHYHCFYWIDDNGVIPLKSSVSPGAPFGKNGFPVQEEIDELSIIDLPLSGYISSHHSPIWMLSVYPPDSAPFDLMQRWISDGIEGIWYVEAEGGMIVPSRIDTLFLNPSDQASFCQELAMTFELPATSDWVTLREELSRWMDRLLAATPTLSLNETSHWIFDATSPSALVLVGMIQNGITYPAHQLPLTQQWVTHPVTIPVKTVQEATQVMSDMLYVSTGELSTESFMEFYCPAVDRPDVHPLSFVYVP